MKGTAYIPPAEIEIISHIISLSEEINLQDGYMLYNA
jgi:hypothetical protein